MSFFKLPLSIAISSMQKGDDVFRSKQKTFGNFNVKKDLNYSDDNESYHKLDIYYPINNSNGVTLLHVHGGGYIYGDKSQQDVFASWFVNQGFTVVVPNYRLGQKDGSINIVDQVKDVAQVLRFIVKEHKYYSLPIKNFFLMGDSAGGHMCLLIDILYKNKELRDYYQIEEMPKLEIKGIALNSTMYDYVEVLNMGKKLLSKRGMKWMFSEKYKDEEFVKMNNPRYYFQNGFRPVPLFANTSFHDYFSNQSYRLNKDCSKFNIEIDYLYEASPNKAIGHVYNHFNFENEEGKRCNQAMVDFFLKNSKVAK